MKILYLTFFFFPNREYAHGKQRFIHMYVLLVDKICSYTLLFFGCCRQQSQFPSKYSHLPQIKSPSPHPMDSQLVPVNATDGKLRLGMRSSGHLDMEGDERIREMEMRLTVSEKSNRALLEEVLRLQNEIKSSGRRSDDILREERKARQDVETSIKVCSDLISQLTARIKTTEERVQEEKMTLSTLVNHTKGVEQVVLSSQHELLNKKAVQSTK